ncbi:hypothetical protein D3C72_2419240 [compost metagenome]
MQQAVGLSGARVHRDAGADEVVAHLQEFDAQVLHGGAHVDGGEFVDGEGFFPEGHGAEQAAGWGERIATL